MPTRPLFDLLRRAGRSVLLPRVEAEERLEFSVLGRWEELSVGGFGIQEPPRGRISTELRGSDLVLVPGLGFDRSGRRLGRGGGHYDRTFPPGAPAPALVGLGFSHQLVDGIPSRSHDRFMDWILTEHGLLRASSRRDNG